MIRRCWLHNWTKWELVTIKPRHYTWVGGIETSSADEVQVNQRTCMRCGKVSRRTPW